MYTLISVLFLIGALMFVGGYVWHTADTDIIDKAGTDVAASIALIMVYAIVLITAKSAPEFANIIGNGIPYVSNIADYGSLADTYHKAPKEFAMSFFDVVLLSVLMDLLKPLLGAGKRIPMSMTKLFTLIVTAVISILILNVFIKKTGAYSSITSIIGAIISFFSAGGTIISLTRRISRKDITAGFFAAVFMFMDNPVSKSLRTSFANAILYVFIIWLMEFFCGSLVGGVSYIISIILALAPCFIMIFGIRLVLRSLR